MLQKTSRNYNVNKFLKGYTSSCILKIKKLFLKYRRLFFIFYVKLNKKVQWGKKNTIDLKTYFPSSLVKKRN